MLKGFDRQVLSVRLDVRARPSAEILVADHNGDTICKSAGEFEDRHAAGTVICDQALRIEGDWPVYSLVKGL